MSDLIIKGASENNLKNIDVVIPADCATVVVGPSGSGKSSLVFDTIYAEGQRRYIESLSSYARQFLERIDKPKVESIENISPTIAVEQKNRIKSSRGTVGTITEIYEYLRLLFSKVSVAHCPKCDIDVKKPTIDVIIDDLIKNYAGKRIYIMFKFKGTQQELLMGGFMRVFADGTVYDLSEPNIKLPEEFYVIYDRFIVDATETNRIWEAFEKSFSLGGRVCYVYVVEDNKTLNFAMDNLCPSCGTKFPEPDPRLFSFDSPIGACPECKGFGNTLLIDEAKLVPDPSISLFAGALDIFNKPSVRHVFYKMITFLREKGVDVNKPFNKLTKEEKKYIYSGGGKGKSKFLGLDRIFIELEKKKYKVYIRVLLSKYKTSYTCPLCDGKRLVAEALNYKVAGKTILDLNELSIGDFYKWLGGVKFSKQESEIAKEILKQLLQRSSFVCDIGLSYLTMNRLAKTLSNGEAQRINLSNQLGSSLVDTIYVLDEPSIGLHPRDVHRLVKIIYKIRDNGNRVIVVEHDPTIVKAMDHVLELGPESGERGGSLVYSGTIDDFCNNADTITSRYLKTQGQKIKFNRRKIGAATSVLTVSGLKENNLRNVKVEIPLNRFVCVTGVSGSGKSSLVTKSLYSILAKHFEIEETSNTVYKDIDGLENINDVMLIDQESIGKSQRSTPITFISGFDSIRGIFAETPLAKSRGYTPSHFSFNVESGQCSVCNGDGFISVDMQFMADIYMKCEVCGGTRYKREILDVTYKEKNISQVLGMTVHEAYDFFIAYQPLRNMFKLLMDVGLDYLVIGQPASTLSGGEAQRLKICKELFGDSKRKKRSRTLYIMDEPTTGLHPSEVDKLLVVIQKLVDEGNSVVVVEHNMDFVKHADHVIDLGPDAGENGGKIIAKGTPEEVAANKNSYTGAFLKELLEVGNV